MIQILSSLLTPLIAAIVTYIAWQQWKTNQLRLKHELFERRFAVYDAALNLIKEVNLCAGCIKDDDLTIYRNDCLPGRFFLRSSTFDYLQILDKKAEELLNINYEIEDKEKDIHALQQTGKLKETRRDITKWFREQGDELTKKFSEDLILRF